MTMTMTKLCGLCGVKADLHCVADSAFLCRGCDQKVHGANFLAARHIRRIICRNCGSVSENCISGAFSRRFFQNIFRCRSCCSLSSSSSSSCLDRESPSTADGDRRKKPTRRKKGRTNGEADGIFVNWCEKLGLLGSFKISVVSSASSALSSCLERLPFRVSLAASFWFGIRVSSERSASSTWHYLRRVEEISGVPRKLIVAAETRLARGMRLFWPRVNLEEGWAESDLRGK